MDVKEAIQKRRSVRSFDDRQVPRSKIEELMESVRMAPSASNGQDWEFLVVDDHTTRRNYIPQQNGRSSSEKLQWLLPAWLPSLTKR